MACVLYVDQESRTRRGTRTRAVHVTCHVSLITRSAGLAERDRFLATLDDVDAFWKKMADFNAVFGAAERQAWPRSEDALRTNHMGVKIASQGRGIGTALSAKTEALRLELQVPLYFSSTRGTLAYYTRRGYAIGGVAQLAPGEAGQEFLLKLGDFGQ
jgi:hypothetical protein